MELIDNYLSRTEFDSYEDFKENFKLDVPENFDFARDIVDKWAEIEPDKLALIYCDDNGAEKYLTFSEISRLSKKAASYFISIGINKGDRVFTLLRRRYEYWICAVALHRIGAVVVPASIQLTTKDIVYRINNAKAKLLIAIDDEFVRKQTEPVLEACETLQNIMIVSDKPQEPKPHHLDFNSDYIKFDEWTEYSGLTNDDEMVIYFTSGTSGYPKMAIHNRTYPLGHIVTARYMQRVQNNGLHLTQSDSGWAKFGWGNIYGQWICGTAILAYDPIRFNTHNLMNVLEKYKPTSLCIPPTMYRFLMHDGLETKHVASIKWFSTAGEPLAGEVNSNFHEISGQFIHEGFGQSEGTPIFCGFEWIPIRPASMGKPSPLYDVFLIHSDGTPCAQGEEGEVVMRVKNQKQVGLLTAYYSDGEMINPFIDELYHTGDIAYEDEDGYYWYVGRNDDMIKSSGYRIGPFEIESVLNTHEAVKESAIVGCPDELRGQIITAVIVLKPGFKGSDELTKELQSYVKKLTAPYKYPRKVIYVDALPKTTSGKIIRKALKEIARS
ncbi:MAG: AMP-binding protein [Clostridiales bacterium]|nr:AMP-binding protein [Clostridiales bacterium]